jgi:hypothetical protein
MNVAFARTRVDILFIPKTHGYPCHAEIQLSDLPELNWDKSPYLTKSSTAKPFGFQFKLRSPHLRQCVGWMSIRIFFEADSANYIKAIVRKPIATAAAA